MSLEEWKEENPSMRQDLQILYELVRKLRPEVILEVGTGHSTLAMLRAMEDMYGDFWRFLYSTDIDNDRVKLFLKKAKDAQLKHGKFYTQDSIKFLSEFEGIADLIFIDSSHEYTQTLSELEEASGKLAPNGYIILHDVTAIRDVRMAVGHFLTIHPDEFKYFVLKTECGLGVLQRK